MIFSNLTRSGCLLLAVVALSLAATEGSAQTVLTIDGRDIANLAGDGNHPTFHNPPVGFAFIFGGVNADNPDAGPGDPPTNTETTFNMTGDDFGALGIGTSGHFFDGPNAFEIDLEVNSANTLPALVLNLKDRDPTPPIGSNVEEIQYSVPLPAAGSGPQTVVVPFSFLTPDFVGNQVDGIPNFEPGAGLEELQLQYPFNDGGSGLILDITVSELPDRPNS